MSCGGCAANHDRAATRAAMCATCRPARRLGLDGEDFPTLCVNGAPLLAMIGGESATCPRGRWPDEAGNVRWLGLVWMGAPFWLRYWIRHKLSRPLPGCGCWARGKRAWLAMQPLGARVIRAGLVLLGLQRLYKGWNVRPKIEERPRINPPVFPVSLAQPPPLESGSNVQPKLIPLHSGPVDGVPDFLRVCKHLAALELAQERESGNRREEPEKTASVHG